MKAYVQRRNSDVFDAINDFFKPMFYDEQTGVMRTDIKETEGDYQLAIELAGFSKEEIKVSLENGYLTVSAEKAHKEEPEAEEGHFIRRERSVSCQRSYYVGDDIEQESIRAKYENGVLTLTVPKQLPQKVSPKTIAIE